MTDAEQAEQAYQGEKNLQRLKNFFAGAPQTGAASNMARDPAQQAGQGRPENSMDDSDDFYAKPFVMPPAADDGSAARAAAAADVNRKAITSTEPKPAPAPAPEPAPAPVQNAQPVPSYKVPGAAQAGQGGYNYTTGVAQDRPHRQDAGADETTRNDYPYVDREGNRKKNDTVPVNPVQNPQPLPGPNETTDPKHQSGGARRPWGTVKDKDGRQVYIDNDGGKWVWPSNSTAWQPANMVPGSDYINKPLRTTTGYTPPVQGATPATGPVSTGRQPWEHTPPAAEPAQAATPVPAAINRGTNTKYKNPPETHPTNMSYDKNGKPLWPMPSPFPANQNAQPAPAGDSVTVKSGDTLSKIAAANGTTVQAIMAANPSIKDANKIAAGQTVKLRESSDLARIRHLAGLTRN
jgi:hypothetical protein